MGERAQRLFEQSLTVMRQLEAEEGMAWCIVGLAGVAWANGEPVRAGRLLGAAHVSWETSDVLLPLVFWDDRGRIETDVRSRLGREEFDAAYAQGQRRGLRATADEVLAEMRAADLWHDAEVRGIRP
jgi:hypothetical protein